MTQQQPRQQPENGNVTTVPPLSAFSATTASVPGVAGQDINAMAEEHRYQENHESPIIKRLRKVPCAGVVLGLMSGICFATASFLVKILPNVQPVEIVVSRSLVQIVFYLPVLLYQRTSFLGVKGERLCLFGRGLFGFMAFSMAYYSVTLIPLADSSTIVFSSPVFVSIFACILIKEPCGLFQTFTIAITMVGVILISKPTFIFGVHESVKDIEYRLEGTLLAFFSCVMTALTIVLIRKLQKTPATVVIFVFSLVSVIFGIGVLLVIWFYFKQHFRLPLEFEGYEFLYLLANGLCGVFGQLFLTIALRIEAAGLISLARTVDIVVAFVFQLAFLNEPVHWTSGLGAVIVCCGVVVSAVRKLLQDKRARKDVAKRSALELGPSVAGVALRIERKLSFNKLPMGSYTNLKEDKEQS